MWRYLVSAALLLVLLGLALTLTASPSPYVERLPPRLVFTTLPPPPPPLPADIASLPFSSVISRAFPLLTPSKLLSCPYAQSITLSTVGGVKRSDRLEALRSRSVTDEDELPLCSSIVANVDSYPVALGCSKEVYRAVKRNATLRPVEHLVSKRGSKHHHHKHHNKSDEHVLTYEPIMLTWTANGNYARTEEIIHSSVASTTARAPCRLLPSQIKTATGAPVNEVHASAGSE